MSAQVLSFPKDFKTDDRFYQMALAKFLRENHLPSILFYELTPEQQSKIITDAQDFKDRSRRTCVRGHEGVARE